MGQPFVCRCKHFLRAALGYLVGLRPRWGTQRWRVISSAGAVLCQIDVPPPRALPTNSYTHLEGPHIPPTARLFQLAVPVAQPHAKIALVPVSVGHQLDAVPVWHTADKVAVHTSARRLYVQPTIVATNILQALVDHPVHGSSAPIGATRLD